MRTVFDTSALAWQPDPAQVRAFRAEMSKSSDVRWRDGNELLATLALIAAPFVFATVLTVFAGLAGTFVAWRTGISLPLIALPVLWVVMVGLLAWRIVVVRDRTRARVWAEHLRCWTFARANNMEYAPRTDGPYYPGVIFGEGDSRRAQQHVYSSRGPIADCGTYVYYTGSSKQRMEHRWQYAAMRLAAPLPHMLLDARANNLGGGSALPVKFTRDQRLSLGTEFDRHFEAVLPRTIWLRRLLRLYPRPDGAAH